ncbi:hypothetical protein [Paraburkholderia sp. J69-1]|uniref:hypothetical protein n=1 Tax=Paraburkholderia sp. J69-1 TaxID=2805436 RepID=UPI002AB691CF|nr:hypothetical protein [Paraburkholderia sp. J69-1]
MNRDASSLAATLLPATFQRANQRTDDTHRADARPKYDVTQGRGATLQAQQPANADSHENFPNWMHVYLEMELALEPLPCTAHEPKKNPLARQAGRRITR